MKKQGEATSALVYGTRTSAPKTSPQDTNASKEVKKNLRFRVDAAGLESNKSNPNKEKPVTEPKRKEKPRRAHLETVLFEPTQGVNSTRFARTSRKS